MAYWNSGAVFNRRGNQNGFTWNSKHFLFVVRLNDTMRAVEGLPLVLARLALQDRSMRFYDALLNAAVYQEVDSFALQEEKPFVTLLVSLAEKLGILDEVSEYIVNLYLSENTRLLEQIKQSAQLITDEAMAFDDKLFAQAYYYLRDTYAMSDASAYFTTLEIFDKFGMTDRTPRTAESDWVIGVEDMLENSFDYFIPLYTLPETEDRKIGMRIDWQNSKLQVMPQQQSVTIELPQVDGEITQSTKYRSRLFDLVLFSDDQLTIQQKEDLKRRITQVLDESKKKKKKLLVQSRGIIFDAKYEDSEIKDGPSYVRCDLSLRVSPYGVDMFPNELRQSGLIDNSDGIAPLSPKFTITGSVSNPYFQLGSYTYRYNGTVPSGQRLIIDFEKYTAYLENDFSVRTNALKNFTGEFHSIPAGSSEALVISSNLNGRFLAEWSIKVLW